MSLYRYLPAPSDRMAVLWTLLSVKGTILLEYGPTGTTHYSIGLLGSMDLETENTFFTTHMSEDDVVMGDVSRLENAISELDENFSPPIIFVMASAITSVIGTDIKSICHYMQDRVKARLIAVDEGGFKGDYSAGLGRAYRLLAKELVQGADGKKAVYNILGASAGSFRMRSDIGELKDLLRRAFGLEAGAVLGLESTPEEIAGMGSAAVNLAIGAWAIPCAEDLKERFGTPFVHGAPYGYSGTLQWLESIGTVLGQAPDSGLVEELKTKAQDARQMRMFAMMEGVRPKATLVGDYDLLRGLGDFLGEMGFTVENRICNHSLQGMPEPAPKMPPHAAHGGMKPPGMPPHGMPSGPHHGGMKHPAMPEASPGIVCPATEEEKLIILKSLKDHLVLGDDISAHVVPKDNTCLTVSSPIFHRRQIATHLPIMGERGADWLMEAVYQYLMR